MPERITPEQEFDPNWASRVTKTQRELWPYLPKGVTSDLPEASDQNTTRDRVDDPDFFMARKLDPDYSALFNVGHNISYSPDNPTPTRETLNENVDSWKIEQELQDTKDKIKGINPKEVPEPSSDKNDIASLLKNVPEGERNIWNTIGDLAEFGDIHVLQRLYRAGVAPREALSKYMDPEGRDPFWHGEVGAYRMSQLEPVLKAVAGMGTYTPGDKESKNVEYQGIPVESWTVHEPNDISMWHVQDVDTTPVPGDLKSVGGVAQGVSNLADSLVKWVGGLPKQAIDTMDTFLHSTDKDEQIKASSELATMFASGGFARGALSKEAENSLGLFGGRMAMNKSGLQVALDADKAGASRQNIRNATGWFKDHDGQWKFEIADNKASWGEEVRKPSKILPDELYRLDEVINHPELFKHYPELADPQRLRVAFTDDRAYSGKFVVPKKDGDPYYLLINRSLAGTDEGKKTVLHEIQHMIQKREGFALGGLTSDPTYHYLAGEVEASNVEARMKMGKDQRNLIDPDATAKVKPQDRIYVYGNEGHGKTGTNDNFSNAFADVTQVDRLKKLETTELLPMLSHRLPQAEALAMKQFDKVQNKLGRDSPEATAHFNLVQDIRQAQGIVKDLTTPGVESFINKDHMRPYLDMILERIQERQAKLATKN